MTEPVSVHVVPHTHWDREWYLPFQRFRLRLVEVVDRVLDLLEADPGYRFTLDGQLATVDDYLAIRPEAEARIRAHVQAGRLALGPWQILMDEFLVSGETIVRNLECGLARAGEFGPALQVGYLPDMFGHVAQMPQLLARAGIDHAVVWRGVPAAVEAHAFRWEAPDGSAVRAEYLVGGYGNAAYLADDPDSFLAGLDRLADALDPFFGRDARLAMAGTDHLSPDPQLPGLLERANSTQDRFRLRLSTLGEYLREAGDGDGLLSVRGELRSAARANMLMGVYSARLDLKAAGARAERLLARCAEPLCALGADEWPEAFLREAWRRVIENSAHDSICGCSADEVCDQVLVRYAEAEQIALGLVERATASVAAGVPRGWTAVFNPSPFPRAGLVELELPVPEDEAAVALELPDGSRIPAQVTGRDDGLVHEAELPGARLPDLLNRLHGRELFGGQVNRVDVDVATRALVFDVDAVASPEPFDAGALERELRAAAAAAPEAQFRLRIQTAARRRMAALVPAPALGWTYVRCVPGGAAARDAVRVGERCLANGTIDVEVAHDGTLRVDGGGSTLSGVGRLVDGGDAGDSYNYAPPAVDRLISEPDDVAVTVLAAGPVVGALSIVRRYRWPVGLADGGSSRSGATAAVEVTTTVELRAGEPFVRLRVSFENVTANRRLRFHVPLGRPAESSFAEGQFAVVERRGAPEGGHGELPLATYPAAGFVDAGGVALLLEHPSDYELVDGELALTLLRSIGLISRSAHPFREDPAGPEVAIPAAQCIGSWEVAFGLAPHAGTWSDADVLGALERYLNRFLFAAGTAAEAMPPEPRPGLELTGRGVVLSSLRRRDGELEARLVCEQDEPSTAVLHGDFTAARAADLLGRPGEEMTVGGDGLVLELAPWEIRTLLLRRAGTCSTG